MSAKNSNIIETLETAHQYSKTQLHSSRLPMVKEGPNIIFLPRRLFQGIGNVSPPVDRKNLQAATKDGSDSGHVENSKPLRNFNRVYDSPKFLGQKDSPNEGPEIDSPFCKELLRSHSFNRKSKLRVLGRGSFGYVIFGFKDGKKIAVKVTKAEETRQGDWNGLGLNHENIVKILKIYESDLNRIVLMEYAGNQNLQESLTNPNNEIPWTFKLRCAIEISSALSHCHEMLVLHRDVKPANIVVSSIGVCKLTDFGSSLSLKEVVGRAGRALNETMVGTVPYLSPELLKGQASTTKDDIYAMAILLWQLVTRTVPYEGEPPHCVIYKVVSMGMRPILPATNDGLSKQFLNIAQLCWSPRENERPTASELCQMLREI